MYGFNGQEKTDEWSGSGNHYTAEYWEYDPRIGRRYNLDPVVKPHQSGYSTFANNPIYWVDPLGANESTHIDEVGNVIAEYDDGDNGVYVHANGTTKQTIDNRRNACDPVCTNVNTDANGRYIGELGGTLDIQSTGIYSNKLAESANKTLNPNFTFGDWYNKVKQNGEWDLKNNKKTIWGVAWDYDAKNKTTTSFKTPFLLFEDASDFGNYHAGFTGSMFGIPIPIQKIGAGFVEQMKDVKSGDWAQVWAQYWQMAKFWEDNAFMDEKDDHRWNTQGMSDALFIKELLDLKPGKYVGVVKVK